MFEPIRRQRGFTLLEALVALAVITLISMVVVGALSPWLGLKQSIENDRRMQDLKQGISAYYEANAMAFDSVGGRTLGAFSQVLPDASGQCALSTAGFSAAADQFSSSAVTLARDGYANPWCVYISTPMSEVRDGVTLWYRVIAFVSGGRNGVIDTGTTLDATGRLVLAPDSDDTGVVISGLDIQYAKLKDTVKRMNRVASMYETYFTTRYLAYADRDISRYYFSQTGDSSGVVPSTAGNWGSAGTVLADIGVGASDAITPWELNNDIQVGNYNETQGTARVRSPDSSGTGALPYTALLRAKLPSPPGQVSYATQVVVGNY